MIGTSIALIAGLFMVGAIIASITKLSASGVQEDKQAALLYAVQSAAGFLLAWVIGSIGLATMFLIR